jgi:hypothetical protein
MAPARGAAAAKDGAESVHDLAACQMISVGLPTAAIDRDETRSGDAVAVAGPIYPIWKPLTKEAEMQSTFMLTTTYPGGLLDSPDLFSKITGVRQAYRQAAPGMEIMCSYKVAPDKTVDFVHAPSLDEAKRGAAAIARTTGTTIEVTPVSTWNQHLQGLAKG